MADRILPPTGDNIIRTRDIDFDYDQAGLGVFLFKYLGKHKEKIAQVEANTNTSDTFESLLRKSIRAAVELKARGITKSDTICYCSHQQNNLFVSYIAALFLGVKVFGLDPTMSDEEVRNGLLQTKPTLIFSVANRERFLEEMRTALNLKYEIVIFGDTSANIPFAEFCLEKCLKDEVDFRPVPVEDIFETIVIFNSSGTTGAPKLICLNHYSIMCQALRITESGIDKNSKVILFYQTVYWVSCVVKLVWATYNGITRLLCPKFDVDQMWNYIEKYNVSYLCLVGQAAALVANSKKPDNIVHLSGVKYLLVGAVHVPTSLITDMKRLFYNAKIWQVYGLTEAGVSALNTLSEHDEEILANKLNSCGRPFHGYWYRVVDTESEENLGPYEQGELRLKTTFQMNGYLNADSTSAWDSDGWIKTGDLFYYDDEYCFFVIDRIKEMVKYKNWYISTSYLEDVLEKHPMVKQAAVISIPHEEDREHALGVVILNENAAEVSPEEITKFVNNQVHESKQLKGGVVIVKEFPCTATGKIKKITIKQNILKELGNSGC